MSDFLLRLIQPVIPVRREEWRKTFLMFLYFGFTISTLYILKPVRNSLFLSANGSERLRYAYVGEGLFLLLFTFFYIALSKRISKRNIFFSITTAFFITNLLLFRFLFRFGHEEWLSFIFYIWVAAYSITIVTQFWTLANDIFNPQEAKRLFGFIISGGSIGGILGGIATQRMAQQLGTENLLLCAAVLLGACLLLINLIWSEEHSKNQEHSEEKDVRKEKSDPVRLRDKSTWKLFFGSRYLLLIAAIVAFAKIASAIVDNQFNSVVEHTILEKNARTAYFGGFLAALNGFSLLIQLLIANRALRNFGVGFSLLLLPIGLCAGSAASVFASTLTMAVTTKVCDGTFNYSINQMAKEILYLPIPRRLRYRVKPLIDMLIYRSSKGVAGLLIIAAAFLFRISDERLGILILILAPFWIAAVWCVRGEYIQAIKKLLANRVLKVRGSSPDSKEAHQVLAKLDGERSFEKLKAFLTHHSSVTRKLSATAMLAFYSGNRDINRVRKLAEEMLRYEALEAKGIRLKFLEDASTREKNDFLDAYLVHFSDLKHANMKIIPELKESDLIHKLSDFVLDSQETNVNKRKAILILTQFGTQSAANALLSILSKSQDHATRFNLIRALNRICSRGSLIQLDEQPIKKEVFDEIKHNESLLTILSEYQIRKPAKSLDDDYLAAAFQALWEESLERIFRLLALLYSSDSIHVIYDRLVELEPDRHIQANALELLENVVEPEIAGKLKPLFEDGVNHPHSEENILETIKNFLSLEDRWLRVCAVFLIAELGLHEFRDDLKSAENSGIPVLQEAASLALLKLERPH